jgi:hypothetical protein
MTSGDQGESPLQRWYDNCPGRDLAAGETTIRHVSLKFSIKDQSQNNGPIDSIKARGDNCLLFPIFVHWRFGINNLVANPRHSKSEVICGWTEVSATSRPKIR